MVKRKAADPVLSAILDAMEEDGVWLLTDDVARDAGLEDSGAVRRKARTLRGCGFHFFPNRDYSHIARCSSADPAAAAHARAAGGTRRRREGASALEPEAWGLG
jgi:hypothetical protein